MRFFAPVLILLCLLLNACTEPSSQPIASSSEASNPTATKPLPDAAAMVQRMITQDGAKDLTAEMRMTAEDEKGKRDQIEFRIQRKYAPDRASTFLTVLSPKEESDKAILAIEKADEATEAFSYLAGLKKLTKLSSDRQLGFRGARVTVQELLGMELGQYSHTAGERVAADGESLIKVEFKQKPDCSLAFPRIVGYFHENDRNPARFELYDSRDELQKRLTFEEVKTIQNRQAITRVAIEDLQQKLKLKLETRRIEYDRGLADTLFTEDHLKSYITGAGRKLIQ
jgi:outer membrane lipoprotein-sorting protein